MSRANNKHVHLPRQALKSNSANKYKGSGISYIANLGQRYIKFSNGKEYENPPGWRCRARSPPKYYPFNQLQV